MYLCLHIYLFLSIYQKKPIFQFKSNDSKKKKSDVTAQGRRKFPLTHGSASLLVLYTPSTDWMRLSHTGEGNLLIQFTHSNVILIQKHPHYNVWSNSWTTYDPVKLEHKIILHLVCMQQKECETFMLIDFE